MNLRRNSKTFGLILAEYEFGYQNQAKKTYHHKIQPTTQIILNTKQMNHPPLTLRQVLKQKLVPVGKNQLMKLVHQ